MKTKNLGHTHMCVSHVNTTIERRRVSVSVGRSVDRYMYASTVFFPPRALCREIILLPTYSTYHVAADSELFQVLLAIGSGFLRASYYITTAAAAAA